MWQFRIMWYDPNLERFLSFRGQVLFQSFLDASFAADLAVDLADEIFPGYSEDWIIQDVDIYMEVYDVTEKPEDGKMGTPTG